MEIIDNIDMDPPPEAAWNNPAKKGRFGNSGFVTNGRPASEHGDTVGLGPRIIPMRSGRLIISLPEPSVDDLLLPQLSKPDDARSAVGVGLRSRVENGVALTS